MRGPLLQLACAWVAERLLPVASVRGRSYVGSALSLRARRQALRLLPTSHPFLWNLLAQYPMGKNPQRGHDQYRQDGHPEGDEVLPEARGEPARPRNPQAGARRQALHAPATAKDCAGAKKGNSCRNRLDSADRISPRLALAGFDRMKYLEG